ncbi:MAG: hypothetical protein UFG06_05190 [Lachnospiraceae bacterium]|nr:hypothetical protein [Lachnospiraceae bacterium]
MEELIKLLCMEECKTKEDFLELRKKAFEIFEHLSPEEQDLVIEDNVFESLSTCIAAFDEE